jgi:tetratricopeptide (TPR) repeat protein
MIYRNLLLIGFFATSLSLSAQVDSIRIAGTQQADTLVNTLGLDPLKTAESLYSKAQYNAAAEIYDAALTQNGPSFYLYYNLGNAYFKSNQLGKAILNYERALRLKPADKDTRFNLEICNARAVDKIDPIEVFLVTRLYNSIGDQQNTNGWALIALVLFTVFIACVLVYFFSRLPWLKKTGLYVGLLSLIICILSLNFAYSKYQALKFPDQAIVMEPTVTVKSSPDQSGTELFPLHEGTKVKITSEIGSWNQIELQDGNVGWLPASTMEVI